MNSPVRQGGGVSTAIRPRRPADVPACLAVLAAVHAGDGYPARWPADPAGWLSPPGLAAAWVAEDDGRLLGHVGLAADVPGLGAADLPGPVGTEPGDPGDRLVAVTRLFVDPAARRRGLARGLLAAARSAGTAAGLQLSLDVVDDGGPAPAVYERLGWRPVGSRAAGWTLPSGRRPQLRRFLAPPP